MFGHHLRKDRIMALPLGADAARNAHAPTGFHRDPCAFVRTNAGAFDIGHQAQAYQFARSPQPRLLILDEICIVDER